MVKNEALGTRQKIDVDRDILSVECTCKSETQNSAYKMYETISNKVATPVICWNNCSRTLKASMLSHCLAVPLPEPKAIEELNMFIDCYVLPPLKGHLHRFDYSFSEYYNHLDWDKQDEQKRAGLIVDGPRINDWNDIPNEPPRYDVFCKRELQMVDFPQDNYFSCGLPKNRAIACPQPDDKFVMAPVTWGLESVFSKHFEGYCGGQNWEEMEAKINDRYKRGFRYIMQGDGSGFDRTQSHELKYLDRCIYEIIAENVWHVDKEVFLTKTTSRYRKLKGTVYHNGKRFVVAKATIDGTVTSGNPDTTLMNTARMAVYIRFMAYKAGVEVEIDCKGDDFAIFYRNENDGKLLEEQFHKYWSKKGANLNEPYGLGLVLKFLKSGDFSTYDFCSTHLICDFNNGVFKIVRQWDRIIQLGAYSMKALSYSANQKRQYLYDQAVAMEKWASGMLYYKDYISFLYKLAEGPKSLVKMNGKAKELMKDDGHRNNHSETISNLGYGRDYHYGLLTRTSKTKMSDDIVYKFFVDKYKLTPSQVVYQDKGIMIL